MICSLIKWRERDSPDGMVFSNREELDQVWDCLNQKINFKTKMLEMQLQEQEVHLLSYLF